MIHRSPLTAPRSPLAERRRGIVLLAVLMVLVLLTLAAYQYAELMLAEYKAADSYRRSMQARAFAESGVHYTAALLANPGSMTNPLDSSDLFSGVLVHTDDNPKFQGRFAIIAPLDPDDPNAGSGQGYRFGMTDEAGKLNLNALLTLDSSGKVMHDMLMTLPNMTEDIVNAIIDWIDPDETPSANGAENSYYSTLSTPYRCKNGPLDSLEELLLVRGVTPQLLFGNDLNRNGVLDPNEATLTGSTLDRGLSAYVTVYSRELNVDSQGNPRIYVNDSDLNGLYQKLTTALGPDLAKFILAYRMYGSGSGGGGTGGNTGNTRMQPAGQISVDALNLQNGRARQSIASLYELLTATVSIPSQNPQQPAVTYASPIGDAGSQRTLLPKLLDMVTTVRDAELPGRINVNTAPRAVLAALPGLTDTDVQNILAHRPQGGQADPTDPIYQTPAWLLTEASLKSDTLRTLERYITARSQVYRAQVIGYFDGGGPASRLEVVIDANNGNPRILFWRDLTELGKGFDLSGMNK
jgi:type II secretory pathway component PulK